MKTPEEWSDMYFKDKVRNLPDLIKLVQEEACEEVVNAVLEAVGNIKKPKTHSL